jgi:transposase
MVFFLEFATMSATLTTTSQIVAIGVGFDTARYGHHVTFLRPDLQPACRPTEFTESQAGYQRLEQLFQSVHQRFAAVHFHIRIDAAGQYATNLEAFLHRLPFDKTISVGEPARNEHYRKALFPKRKADPVESLCAARFALLEQPKATSVTPPAITLLREIVARLEGQTRQSTRLTNQLHNLLARVFPEFATLASDLQAAWVLQLFDAYPTPARIARAQLSSLTKIPHLTLEKAQPIQTAAKASVASLTDDSAAELVRQLVAQLRHSLAMETELKKLMTEAHQRLGDSNHLESIPGIGVATAAVLTAKMVDCQRFATAGQLISYFGVFPEDFSSGVDKQGQPKSGRLKHMSRKGNDLVRKYLWNAAKSAIRHNPAVKALYQRLRARGARGDVALGHCMRKLLQLVWAVWKTGKPFDSNHYPWQNTKKTTDGDKKTAGHNQELSPERKVVTTVDSSINLPPAENNREPLAPHQVPPTSGSVPIDFAALRAQVSMEQVLAHLGCFSRLRGTGPQRRGSCPIHNADNTRQRSFSVHLGKKVFQCFHPPCGAKGNVLDLWAAVHRLPLHQAAVHLAQTFNITLQTGGETEKRNP